MFLTAVNVEYPTNEMYFIVLETTLALLTISLINCIKKNMRCMGYEKLTKFTTIDGIDVYHRKYDKGSAHTYFPFSYITIDFDSEIYKHMLHHELTHIKYHHVTILLVTSLILFSYFDSAMSRCILLYFSYVYSYLCEMHADYNSIKYINDEDVLSASEFHTEHYRRLMDDLQSPNFKLSISAKFLYYLDYHPNSGFRSSYIRKIVAYRRLGIKVNFFTFCIDQFYPFLIKGGYSVSLKGNPATKNPKLE